MPRIREATLDEELNQPGYAASPDPTLLNRKMTENIKISQGGDIHVEVSASKDVTPGQMTQQLSVSESRPAEPTP